MAIKLNIVSYNEIKNNDPDLINIIEYDENKKLLITGVPGSGKTTAAIYRAQRLENMGKSFKFITYGSLLNEYTKQSNVIKSSDCITTIFSLLRLLTINQNIDLGHLIGNEYFNEIKRIGPNLVKNHNFDENTHLLIDEAQDIDGNILSALATKVKGMTICGDPNQTIFGENGLQGFDEENNFRKKNLKTNHRNTKQIREFAKSIKPNDNILASIKVYKEGPLPEIIVGKNDNLIEKII